MPFSNLRNLEIADHVHVATLQFHKHILQTKSKSPCWHRTLRIAFRLKKRPELCLSTSQQPTTLYGTAASPVSSYNFCLTNTWFKWPWR